MRAECGLVAPPVEFFQEKRAEQRLYAVRCAASITVVSVELNVGQRLVGDELFDGVMGLVVEPDGRDDADVLFKTTRRTSVVQGRCSIGWPVIVKRLSDASENCAPR